ncbi:murein tripeptide ABC transporter/oligopeptide ABC transporter ATP binding subunit OppD [Vibrio chagasii]|uniref:ABC transporter ATP-binding protein n=1 Tax=Vibrio splendidus TaxID=29497 RepID=UPI00076A86E7|nr:ABC transporter ATP-binding protein [Vibrio splendidus]CAH6846872.1 murein tripeptide ABC transporter/oligopeptide ABC transporter ATP binding subunit OppD [Vibrio chagasii]CAH6856332.1 murein tripeptide ABC transporter/oligopeptide ABC transporter ATP binding subunit OppD [Vibrio chagasii]CAH6946880.1 murein tripeptide ABC transporter/oligopeptide ABC transporter ATP binding subunit OppD [Vibrio chagasii]CAH6984187.1 murein tripeptide ABC transporter/oligopeptide ABC transporter ATP binding
MSNLLEINNLCVDYVSPNGVARAVNDVSISIAPGETLGIAGESGCGKSTLAFAISRLHKAPALISEGEILYKGQDVLKMNNKQLRDFRWNDVSIVFQSAMNSLNPVITIGEQLTDVILAHKKIPYKQAHDRAVELLGTVGIHGDRMSSFPHQLSGGMRQRVVIAIALALEPKLIIMDEPTTALDVVVEREILNELYELKSKFGFSILFISHDLSLMGEIADRIGVMYAGNLIELGDAKTVFSEPKHPYTKGLISSFPTIHGPKERLYGIPGNPVNLLDTPQGCNFQERCGECISMCIKSEPRLGAVATGHHVSCHLV